MKRPACLDCCAAAAPLAAARIVVVAAAVAAAAVAAAAVAAAAATSLLAQGEVDPPPAVVEAFERSLVEVIAAAERSVVAISRVEGGAPQAAASPGGDSIQFRIEAGRVGEIIWGDLRAPEAPRPVATGAGVIIDPAGLVLTQYLSVREGDDHTITTTAGETFPATIRGADPRSGLAVLAIDAREARGARSFPALAFGDAAVLRKGQFVVAIGNPYAIESDSQPTASWGIVTNLSRKAPPGTNLNDAPGPSQNDYRTTLHHLGTLIQTDAKLGFGAGGGALVNLRGELVGLTTTVSVIAGHEQPAGYAIPINGAFRRIIETLQEGREVEYGLLGVSFSPVLRSGIPGDLPRAEAPLAVQQVLPGTPAARGGLQTGDVVTHVADEPVREIDELQLQVSLIPPAERVAIRYRRGEQESTAQITLTKLPIFGRTIATNRPGAWRGMRVDYATAGDPTVLIQGMESGGPDPAGCVLVAEVAPESEAWQAGVRAGMFLSHVGSQRVSTPGEFRAAAREARGVGDLKFTLPLPSQQDGVPFEAAVEEE